VLGQEVTGLVLGLAVILRSVLPALAAGPWTDRVWTYDATFMGRSWAGWRAARDSGLSTARKAGGLRLATIRTAGCARFLMLRHAMTTA